MKKFLWVWMREIQEKTSDALARSYLLRHDNGRGN